MELVLPNATENDLGVEVSLTCNWKLPNTRYRVTSAGIGVGVVAPYPLCTVTVLPLMLVTSSFSLK